ncbi:glycine betaine/L-proline ABC transporter ATP-binding protein ProV [Azospirillum sp. YIM DDC1]|uniref:Quaternary amine transport ATP-binding protein n=2 Tax=Azospirillum TaxID=191 RepID=A0ABW0GET6_9PROT|nr:MULTISPECIES: glycine betaine/L-proline ABC transporter ATP-binding protein ProV [Azospirillum]MBK3775637.1 glycine betaine/L-proline ABC transporter ATP-binding protein ProV [Azospirillum brasilense]MBK4722841.1 glycine betaine/L-proline ABC transporter ATP-binding protein ProV [Azospirillum aestuarii]NUB11933.1 glycine betaine/L-proline ABC transporter ATP-binding protein ProV [Azospirillum brasilense]NUB26844.1 glycine betaine/L-proline ABC transporter ATP-binding protein ProV [Azospirill
MTAKIAVNGVTRIFGRHPRQALDLLKAGLSKEEIFKRTGQTVGVLDASFEVEAGEIFVIMGLSGSGKSTLVRMLNRLIDPTAGEIRIDGRDITKLSRAELTELRRRDLGMVFQSFALLPHLRVWENAAFGLEIAGESLKARRDKAQQALDAVGLGAYAESFPRELSGGMQQRVGLARALANEPSVLLMDEAFSALDPLIRTEMQDELLRLQAERQRTIVFISHDLDEAIRIGDRLAIMEGGQIIQVGRPDEILKQPANDYVRSFFRNIDVTKILTAGDIARRDQVTLIRHTGEGPRAAVRQLRERDREFGYVQDGRRRFHGVVSVETLVSAIERHNGSATLDEALLPGIEPLPVDLPMDEVLPRIASAPCPLPVVDGQGAYVGAISKTAYLETLGRTR